ncbi:MAG: transposase [Bdellovibrionales bacterium]|nr:transposase [Bdellovibrionales bacterium]
MTSALSEGIDNVIETVKRKAYGYRSIVTFDSKLCSVCS